jgi:hypothetical protein
LFAVPIGVIGGVYAAEFQGTRLATMVQFAADTLNGVPSIVIGVFVYGIAVLPVKQFSAFAGSLALGIMMIPIITRTTEELVKLVPVSLREGALALGATRARATMSVVLPAAAPGIITGVVLALARIAGETGASPLHRVQQSFLLDVAQSTDLVADGAGLYLRYLAVRRMASSGVGGGAGPRLARAHVLHPGAACHSSACAAADGAVATRLAAVCRPDAALSSTSVAAPPV